MTTKIYDTNRLRSKQSPWTDAFLSSFLLPVTVPLLLVFAVYMFWSSALEFGQTAAAGSWQTTSGELIQVVAPPYWDNCFEPWTMFLPAAKITYRYEIGAQVYPGEAYLKPQGPRFYPSLGEFCDSGDDLKANRKKAYYETQYKFEPIGGWSKPRTAYQVAAPFKLAALAPSEKLAVRYDPTRPAQSVLFDVLNEHATRLVYWGIGAIIVAALFVIGQILVQNVLNPSHSDDRDIESIYDQLNPESRKFK